jgi:hypothetical protein
MSLVTPCYSQVLLNQLWDLPCHLDFAEVLANFKTTRVQKETSKPVLFPRIRVVDSPHQLYVPIRR